VRVETEAGTDLEHLLKDACLRLLEDEGFADRGELIEESEMNARFEKMLRS
jgi:hypothetical protein